MPDTKTATYAKTCSLCALGTGSLDYIGSGKYVHRGTCKQKLKPTERRAYVPKKERVLLPVTVDQCSCLAGKPSVFCVFNEKAS